MSWEDRLQEAAYTTPSGSRRTFQYEDVSEQVEKRTRRFGFPRVAGDYIQDNGHRSHGFPLLCFFSGDDHDTEAAAFFEGLLERGMGRLEHPLYGTKDVLPTGGIGRRDDLKRAANQSVVKVTFFETTGLIYPSSQRSPRDQVGSSIDDFDKTAAQQFAEKVEVQSATARKNLAERSKDIAGKVLVGLGPAAKASSGTRREFEDAGRSFVSGADTLAQDPAALSRELGALIRAPAASSASLQDRLRGYTSLFDSVISDPAATPWTQPCACANPRRQVTIGNDFQASDLAAMAALSAMADSMLAHAFSTRPEATSAAQYLLGEFDRWTTWRDQGFGALQGAGLGARLGQIDTGEAYQAIQRVTQLAAGYLVEVAFALPAERTIVLDRQRTIIDLCAELYGVVDEKLDFFIDSNELTGSEILLLPRGREIRYYA